MWVYGILCQLFHIFLRIQYRDNYQQVTSKAYDGCQYDSTKRENVRLKVSKRASITRHKDESEDDEKACDGK